MVATRAFLDDKEWRKYVKKTQKTIKKSSKLLEVAFSTIGFRNIIKHFKDEKDPGGKWQPRKDDKPHGLLKDTGKLRQGILPGNTRKINNKSILIFNSTLYSGVQDRGSKKRNIPARQFMWFDSKAMEAIGKFFLSKIT